VGRARRRLRGCRRCVGLRRRGLGLRWLLCLCLPSCLYAQVSNNRNSIVMYLMIMTANLYISLRPTDATPLSPRPSRTRRNRSSGVQTTPEMGQLPAPRDSLIDPTGEPPPPYTARPGHGESIAVAPTSHPAIERVAASRVANVGADVDVERLAGSGLETTNSNSRRQSVPDYPCVDYDTLEGLASGIGISLGMGGTSSSAQTRSDTVAEASSNTASSSGTAITIPEMETEGETPDIETEITRTVHHTTSTTPLINPPTSQGTARTPSS
jgi:hypothetical protein